MIKLIRHIAKTALLAGILFISSKVSAQEMMGIMNSNYAGVTSVTINPSNMTFSRLKFDFNIIGADIFVNNNYVYYPKESVSSGELYKGNAKLLDFNTPNPAKSAYLNVFAKLPSLMVCINERHTFAFSTHVRTNVSVENLDYGLAKVAYEDDHFRYAPLQNKLLHAGPFYLAAMSWSELAFSYSYLLKKGYRDAWSVGATIKPMFGLATIPLVGGEAFSAAFINGNSLSYIVTPKAVGSTNVNFNVLDVDMEYGRALNTGGIFTGAGVGADIGFTYVRKKNPGKYVSYYKRLNGVERYIYRLGVSLIDIGAVSYSNSAKTLQLKSSNVNWSNVDTTKFRSFSSFDETASAQFYNGNILGSKSTDAFSMGLPTASSIQFDYNLNDKFYVGSIWVQPLTFARPAIVRPANLSLIPRFETKYFEASLPVTMYNYSDLSLGMALRMGPLIIGTDRLGTFIGLNNVTGLDVYFAIKVMTFKENQNAYNPFLCFYNRVFKKFQRKAPPPKIPVSLKKK